MVSSTARRPQVGAVCIFAAVAITLLTAYGRMPSSFPFGLFEPSPSNPSDGSDILMDPVPVAYDTSSRPPLKGLTNIIADLPKQFVPVPEVDARLFEKRARRLVIVGDVHGQKKELEALLDKIEFDRKKGDHLIFTGDLVSKGPDSAGVVALAMRLGAHAVRGNHEDRVLLAAAAMKPKSEPDGGADGPGPAEGIDLVTKVLGTAGDKTRDGQGDEEDESERAKNRQVAEAEYDDVGEERLSKGERHDRKTARSLSAAQLKWLRGLPVILRVGAVPRPSSSSSAEPAIANLVVVHGGLVPNVKLEKQDPWAVMNMRSLVYPADEVRWQAVKEHMEKVAAAAWRWAGYGGGGGDGDETAAAVPDADVDAELARIINSQGPSFDRSGDMALPSEDHDGVLWTLEWNKAQRRLADESQRWTVVFGHDAKTGLNVGKEKKHNHKDKGKGEGKGKDKHGGADTYAFGLDSGCVYGRKLSALVIEAGKETVEHRIVQVNCSKAK